MFEYISYRTSFIRDKYFELNGDFSSSYYPLVIKSGVYYYLKDSISWIKRGDLPTEYVNRNINLGLGRVVGGLGCKVNIIPNLLIPDVVNAINNLINHDTLQILRDTIINDYECYLIKATLGEINNKATLDLKKQNVQIYEVYEAYYSIRKSDLVILALTNKITYPDKIKVETMQFAPIINNKNYVKRKKEFK